MTEDTKNIEVFSGELRSKLATRIDHMGETDYDGMRGEATLNVIEEEIFRFIGKTAVTAFLHFFKKNK